MWLVPGLGWKVQEGFTHMSSILVLFPIPSLALLMSLASAKHSGLRVVRLQIWQQASKREEAEADSSFKILDLEFPQRSNQNVASAAFCWSEQVTRPAQIQGSGGNRSYFAGETTDLQEMK